MKRIGEILNEPQKMDTPEILKHVEHHRPDAEPRRFIKILFNN